MFTDKKNILQLIAVIKGIGIRKVVLSPGSRNIPLVQSFLSEPFFECYSVTDERSAGFFAIGLSLEVTQKPQPVVVCCTSGTAVANLYPAVAEAYYQKIPLVVISADRPQEWIGQMDGQTLPQPGLFGSLVKKAVNLPIVSSEQDEWYCNRLVNEALLELYHRGIGPVHINVPIDEPLFDFNTERLSDARIISRYYAHDNYSIGSSEHAYAADNKGTDRIGFGVKKPVEQLLSRLGEYYKIMIICGQMPPAPISDGLGHSDGSNGLAGILMDSYVCLGEQLGNNILCDNRLYNFDLALYAIDEGLRKELAPDLLITFGGHVVSKRLKSFLRKNKPKEHWHVSLDGEVADLFCCLTAAIEMEPAHFLSRLVECEKRTEKRIKKGQYDCVPLEFVRKWRDCCSSHPSPHFEYSQMGAIEQLLAVIPKGSALHLSNSSSVRYAQLFKLDESIKVFCNRGVNGIEGSLSSAIGYAAASEHLNFVIIGDLSFFYDMNALWNGHLRGNLRIMMINNGCGEIFHSLPGLKMDERARSFVTATHSASAKGWAEERGFKYFGVHDSATLNDALAQFTGPETGSSPMFIEVFTLPDKDVKLLKDFYHSVKTAKR